MWFRAILVGCLLTSVFFSCQKSIQQKKNEERTEIDKVRIEITPSKLSRGSPLSFSFHSMALSEAVFTQGFSWEVFWGDKSLGSGKERTGEVDTTPFSTGPQILHFHLHYQDTILRVQSRPILVLAQSPPISYTYKQLARYNHRISDYTQGLTYWEGLLYEGTGQRKASLLRVQRGLGSDSEVIKEIRLNDEYFGEGVALYGDKIYQLTWTSHTGFIYDKESLEDAGSFRYATEGWGLTHWNTYLVMSDGSERLHFYDTKRWKLKRSISVYDDKEPISRLNELENIEGLIYANVYETDFIVIIEPSTGEVVGRIDLGDLFDSRAYAKETGHRAGVMNGIAATPEGHLLITGKLWPYLYELEITPRHTP